MAEKSIWTSIDEIAPSSPQQEITVQSWRIPRSALHDLLDGRGYTNAPVDRLIAAHTAYSDFKWNIDQQGNDVVFTLKNT